MRQWMVDPRILCRKHLLGEHVEHHMFIGTIKRKCQLDGCVQNNLVEPAQFEARHNALVAEMKSRGMRHKSDIAPQEELNGLMSYLSERTRKATVNVPASLADLIGGCPDCRARYEELKAKGVIE